MDETPDDLLDELADAAPRCPSCGHLLEPAGEPGRSERWECEHCGFVRL